jgi:hypothetical protein
MLPSLWISRAGAELPPLRHSVDVLGEQVVIVRVDERRRVDPDQLVVLVAVHPAKRRVDLHHQTRVEVVDNQPVAGRVKDPPVLLLALEQLLLGARPLPT